MYKMLIAEDEIFVRVGLENIVNWAEYQIRLVPSASNGREALELYEKYHPDIIITDIRMPEMDGLELIAAVRERDRHVRFMVLTCLEDYQTVKRALNLSVSHYYNKSDLDLEELQKHIAGIVHELSEEGVPAETDKVQEDAREAELEQWGRFFFEGISCETEKLLLPFRMPGGCYYLIQMELKDRGENGQSDFFLVKSLLEAILLQQKAGHLLAARDWRTVLLYGLAPASPEQRVEQITGYLQHLEQSMQNYFNLSVRFTSSTAFSDLGELPVRWEEVVRRAGEQLGELLPEEQIRSEKLFSVVQYVREHLAEDITLSSAAEFANFSAGYLGTLFRKEMNISFSEFVLNMRLRKAKFLLTRENDTLAVIAEKTGLYDASYLVKVFKKAVGLTPNEYRQRYREGGLK